ncbi:MAG: HEPN domain-containing protein [Candidatus Schekmanbacteria bacterium]|nr:HEPN domain-containing protein [Candidatus Schekmanbacteria bacterium]
MTKNKRDDSIGRSYYAIFTAARALLATKGLDSKRHSGVIALFNQNFIKDGPLDKEAYQALVKAKANREEVDYGDQVSFSQKEAEDQLVVAENFLTKVEKVLKGILKKQEE